MLRETAYPCETRMKVEGVSDGQSATRDTSLRQHKDGSHFNSHCMEVARESAPASKAEEILSRRNALRCGIQSVLATKPPAEFLSNHAALGTRILCTAGCSRGEYGVR